MKKALVLILVILTIHNVQAQTKYPVYEEVPLTKPKHSTTIAATDFQLSEKRLKRYPNGTIFASAPALKSLFNYLKYDSDGKDYWNAITKSAAASVSDWKLSYNSNNAYRYVYANLNSLPSLSYVYMFSGNPLLLEFIRANLQRIAGLPLDFWLHSELRGMDEKKPLGQLETAMLSASLGYCLSMIEGDMPAGELAVIRDAFYNKGLVPCLNWLDKPRLNNFTAVIGDGAFVASKYFGDANGRSKALNAITYYLNNTIETDGSYGEGVGYFNYPISTLLSSLICMDESERSVFRQSNLARSSKWVVYSMLFQRDQQNKLIPSVINFGDNCPFENTLTRGKGSYNAMLSTLFSDSLLAGLHKKYNLKYSFEDHLLMYGTNAKLPAPASPSQLALPTARVFNNGDCFIRSSWDDNAIVFGMRSGDGGKVRYNHQRPELHSIALAAYGELFIGCTGSASYRSPIYYGYDKTTMSANTITIDMKNQLFPGTGVGFIKFDNSAYWVSGEPKSEVTKFVHSPGGTLLRCDAPAAYHIDMEEASRTVQFVPEGGFFIVVDRMKSKDGSPHTFNYRFHMNNRDEKAVISSTGTNTWMLNRPMADLHIALWSSVPIDYSQKKGYMHGGTARDYSPGGPAEGKLGSALEMDWSNKTPVNNIQFVSVLFPQKKNQVKPVFSMENGEVVVNGKRYRLPE